MKIRVKLKQYIRNWKYDDLYSEDIVYNQKSFGQKIIHWSRMRLSQLTSYWNFASLKMLQTVSKKWAIFNLANGHFKTFCVG